MPVEFLGDGGTGLVIRCLHREIGTPVAVKTANPDSAASRDALRREIGVLCRLKRAGVRGILGILEHGVVGGTPWYAMPFIDGKSLRAFHAELWGDSAGALQPDPMSLTVAHGSWGAPDSGSEATRPSIVPSPDSGVRVKRTAAPAAAAGQLERVLAVMLAIAKVLESLHAQGVVHGDLTPSNVLLPREDDPILIDFGTSLVSLESDASREAPSGDMKSHGTPGYLAPEVISGEQIDARCDLYGFGCILYELVTGRRPFIGVRLDDVIQQQLGAEPPPLSTWVAGVPLALERLVRGLLEKDPEHRTLRAADVSRVIRGLLDIHGPAEATEPTSVHLYRPKLRGRDDALASLQAGFESARRGRGGLWLVKGSSGVGKTRLFNELGRKAAAAGMRVLWCQARRMSLTGFGPALNQGGGLELFRPLLESVAHAYRPGDEPPPDLSEALDRLRPFAPGLFEESLGQPIDRPQEDSSQSQTFEALFRLVQHLSEPCGLLLLIDDLQWADELSLKFLADYARRFSGSCILALGNYRIEEASSRSGDLLNHAQHIMELRPLQPVQVRAVTRDLLGTASLPEGLAAFLHKKSEGNPFLLCEYVRACMGQKALWREEDGSWVFDIDNAEERIFPRSLVELMDLRVKSLSTRSKDMLKLVSVLSRDFDASMAAALLGSEIDCSEVLEELVARQILTISTKGCFHFEHDKMREGLERALTRAQRLKAHRRAAMFLETLGDPIKRDYTADLGYHWFSAGEPERALPHLEAAATHARRTYALTRATDFYRLALRASVALKASIRCEKLETRIQEELADVLVAQGAHGNARRSLEAALLTTPHGDRLARARLNRKMGASHWTVHEYNEADQALSRAEEALGPLEPDASPEFWTELVQIRLGRFEQLYFSGRTGPVLDALVRDLAPLIEHRGSTNQRCAYYFVAASHLLLRRRYAFDADAVVLARKGLDVSASLSTERQALAQFMVGFTLVHGPRDCCCEAIDHFEAAAWLLERSPEVTLLARIRVYLALAFVRSGQPEAAAAASVLAADAAEVARLVPYVAAAHACQGWVAWRRGDTRRARRLLESARETWRSQPHKHTLANLAIFPLLAIAQTEENFDALMPLLEELQSGYPELPPQLTDEVRSALRDQISGSPRQVSDSISRILGLATHFGFA